MYSLQPFPAVKTCITSFDAAIGAANEKHGAASRCPKI